MIAARTVILLTTAPAVVWRCFRRRAKPVAQARGFLLAVGKEFSRRFYDASSVFGDDRAYPNWLSSVGEQGFFDLAVGFIVGCAYFSLGEVNVFAKPS